MASSETLTAGAALPAVSPSRRPLDALLGWVAEVHAGEGVPALLMMLNVFLLLSAYYLLKTIREPLVLAAPGGGAAVKSYASAAIAVLLIVLVPVYGAIAARVSRVRLINGVTAFFVACLVGFLVWAHTAGPSAALSLGVTFFVWVGIFNLMLIAQFWAFAADVYTVEQGKRLFAVVAFGASLGAIVGAFVARPLTERLGVDPLMGIAAGLLGACMVLTNVIHLPEPRH